ncbi:hypothetical protein SSBR45G_56930 [Bradyrhizobium sp. SSBR45G]|uniref:hypothetical protein n=1 Tax=unclassified Bradyrhizobium TaxID=2631580 RepID=UPI002342AED0|nr:MULTISPECIES: hypothetical protein [unclassified Bradyrhizobium]GLH80784.1 hypothetical protein SSBR45G_56930 [Bradyrhizobium sp. SSBR45G]GLH88178.1 hypothetical protein SSBR45R_56390 [Bradyrhizobium sp. SSBR45R]
MFTRRDVTQLFVKAFGLLVLLSAVAALPATISNFDVTYYWTLANVADRSSALVMIAASHFGPIAVYAAFGLGLMWWSRRLVDKADQALEDRTLPTASSDLKNMEVSLVTVIGLYFLADGFAELFRFAFLGVIIHGHDGTVTLKSVWTNLSRFEIVTIVQSMVKLTIGAGLVLGRGATAAALRQARRWVKKGRAWPDEPKQIGRT